jgi:Cof subfamily protein (haloacid dehalogenase superfamily)
MTTPKIRLLLSDVDGTLVTSDKVLTERSVDAVNQLRDVGILFAITSSRPPGGLAMFAEPLKLTTPISAFNGGFVMTPTLEVTDRLTIDDDVIKPLLAMIDQCGLSTWVYRGEQWFVRDLNDAHVQHEAEVVQFQPRLVDTFDDVSTNVAKIVVVDDDAKSLAAAAASVRDHFGGRVSATSSQSFCLDITNPQANKGVVVTYLSNMYNIPTNEIATIGDAQNDVLMFAQSGISIAMGNAVDDVQVLATYVTTSNDNEGFANAVHEFILK